MASDRASREDSAAELVSTWREERVDVDTDGEADASTYRVTWQADEELPTVVVMTVAAIKHRRPTELPTLASVVDPDAVHRFVTESTSPTAMVRFAYANCRVKVRADGDVIVHHDAA
jgi:hypothetical protein